MKLLSLTNLNSTNYNTNYQNRNSYYNLSDMVSFKSRTKIVKSTIGIQEQKAPEILNIVKNMLKNDKTKQLFTKIAQVLLGAAVVTEYLTTGEDSDTKKLLRKELKKAGIDVKKELKTEKRKVGRKPKYNKDELKEKIQMLAKKGMTQAQIAVSLGLSRSYTAVLMKNLDIQTNRAQTYGQGKKDLINKYIQQNPERKAYTKYLENYPKLLTAYTNIISEHLNQQKNDKISEKLNLIEQIFESLYSKNDEIQKLNTKYFKNLEAKYSDDFDIVTKGLKIHLDNNAGIYSYLNEIIKENTSKKDIEEYIQNGTLNFYEFMSLNGSISETSLKSLQKIKDNDNLESFHIMNRNENDNTYDYRVQFKEGIPLKDKLKDIVAVNEALHGPLEMYSRTKIHPILKLKQELLTCAINDKDIQFSYNILRFLEPEKTKEFKIENNLHSRIDLLRPNDKKFQDTQEYIINRLKVMGTNNENLQILYQVLNNEENFTDTLQNNHAKLRFIGRFVLNHICAPDKLESRTRKYGNILDNELNFRLETGCRIFPYTKNVNGIAPSLYLGKTSLGNYVKITLNNDGQIQTIFQDLPTCIRNQARDRALELLQQ